jgi:phosphatidylglycerophosphatase A
LKFSEHPALKGLIVFLSSGTFLGHLPLASGTFGTLWGLPLYYWLSGRGPWFQVVFIVGVILAAVYLAGQAEIIWARKDPSYVVIDEIAGFLTAVAGWPFSWFTALAAFLIFRFMDILKPYPIRKIDQKLPGGWGIVLDDVLAGIYTNLLLHLWSWVFS